MKFRFHKGSLAESMATQFEFKNKQDLINKINEYYGFNCIDEKTFKCSFYCYDGRINENTHIVESYENKKNHWVIGMADCMVNDEQTDKTNEKIKRLEQTLKEIKEIVCLELAYGTNEEYANFYMQQREVILQKISEVEDV